MSGFIPLIFKINKLECSCFERGSTSLFASGFAGADCLAGDDCFAAGKDFDVP